MLKAEHITYKIGKKKLLDDISAEFEPGKINLVIGPNGAGKSTFVKVISGVLSPQRGEVHYEEKNLKEISVQQQARRRAVLSQDIDLAFPLTVSEVVMMGRYPYFSGKPTSKDLDICGETIKFFDLEKFRNRDYLTMSGGERQRVQFARVAAQIWDSDEDACRFLILDEPLTFLDVYYQFDFMNKVEELVKQRNWVVVGVLHDLNLVGKYADYVLLLHQAKRIAWGKKEEVLTKQNIRSVYGLEAEVLITDGTVRLHF